MYFSVVKDREDLCRLEWADLKAIAGTAKNFVAFGSAHSEQRDDLARNDRANVHKPGDVSPKPIPYPLNHGLARLRTERPEESDRAGEGDFNRNPVVLLKKFLQDHPPERP
jgi:hypothetical protein